MACYEIHEQLRRLGVRNFMIGGLYLNIMTDIINNCGCPIVRFSLERQEDRKTHGDDLPFIMTIYEGPKERGDIDIDGILKNFPPIFETIKRDLGIKGDPDFYLGEP
jgi:hypothetical protein